LVTTSSAERDRVVRLVRHASVGWAEAMRAHKLAAAG